MDTRKNVMNTRKGKKKEKITILLMANHLIYIITNITAANIILKHLLPHPNEMI